MQNKSYVCFLAKKYMYTNIVRKWNVSNGLNNSLTCYETSWVASQLKTKRVLTLCLKKDLMRSLMGAGGIVIVVCEGLPRYQIRLVNIPILMHCGFVCD